MNVGKKLRKFIFLNVFAMMGMSCYILADTFFISVANGTLGIAALNLTLPHWFVNRDWFRNAVFAL